MLTAGAGRAVGIDTKVLLVDFDLLGDLLEEGRHLHGREGGLALALVVERRDAHKSVHTVLGLHQPIGVAALEHELDIAEAGLGAFGDGENLDVEAPLVGPAVVHPHQHLGPVLRIGAALTGLDLTNGIALVEFPGEQRAHLKLVEHRLERGGLLGDLGSGTRRFLREPSCGASRDRRLPLETVVELKVLIHRRELGGDLPRLLLIVPKVGTRRLCLELRLAHLELVDSQIARRFVESRAIALI